MYILCFNILKADYIQTMRLLMYIEYCDCLAKMYFCIKSIENCQPIVLLNQWHLSLK